MERRERNGGGSSRHLSLVLLLVVACGESPPAPPDTPPELPPPPVAAEAPPEAPRRAPRLRFEAPSTEAGYDPAELVAAVHQRALRIRRCFENLGVHDNVPPGRVVVSFTVRTDGTIGDAHTLEGGTYGDCVAEEIERVRLERGPDAPTVVIFPMVFEAGP